MEEGSYSFLLFPTATTGHLGYNRALISLLNTALLRLRWSLLSFGIALRKDVRNLKESEEFNMIKYNQ